MRFFMFLAMAIIASTMIGCTNVRNPFEGRTVQAGDGQVTATPTATATTTTQRQVTGDGKGGNGAACPTDDAMQQAHGFTSREIKPVASGGGMPWEGCKWTVQSVGIGSYEQPMLPDWQYTVTLDDGHQTVAVFYGEPNLSRKVFGATIRYRPAHNTPANNWVNRPCDAPNPSDQGGLLAREVAFGFAPERGSLTYPTVPGNIRCGTGASGGQSGGQASSGGGNITKDWLASNVGGSADKWALPTHAAGAWVFVDKGHPVALKYPGSGKLDVWIGQGSVSVTADNAGELNGKTFDEASYHPNG